MPTEKPKQKNEPLKPTKNARKKAKTTNTSSKNKRKEQQSKLNVPSELESGMFGGEEIKLNRRGYFEYKLPDGQRFELTLLEWKFCICYLQLSGNRTQAVIGAGYDVYFKNKEGKPTGKINYNLAGAIGSENLRKPKIFNYVNMRLEDYGYNDDNVKKQHLFLVNQLDNLNAKAKGLDMYYKTTGAYVTDKNQDRLLDLLEKTSDLPDDELE